MKKLVCILGGYTPYYSPSGKIAANVLNELKKEFDITVIAQKNYFGLSKNETIDGIEVIRINEWNRMFHHLFEGKERQAKTSLSRTFCKTLLGAKRVINYVFRLLRKQSFSEGYVKKIINRLEKIEKEERIDFLMPVSIPHEAVVASVRYKKKHGHVKIYPYKTDFFACASTLYENGFIKKIRYPRHIKTEQETLEACEKLFALPPIAAYYDNNRELFPQYEKVIRTEHPLLVKPDLKTFTEADESDKITLVYAGSFYSKLRNPELVFDFLTGIEGFKDNYLFKLFSFGDCQPIVDKYKKEFGSALDDRGKVSSGEVANEMSCSDIIITIGNNSATDVPSKLFECLSFGKPIIHFYFNDADSYLDYLKNYEYSLCVKIDPMMRENFSAEFDAFCKRNKNTKIDFETVKNNFRECTPEYVASLFAEEFKR